MGFDLENFEIEHFKEGTWNRLFTIRDTKIQQEYIFRVSLPIYPWYKTEAEVATMEFIQTYTSIPVPKVYAFSSSANNELGYEWILMEKVHGTSYSDCEDDLTTEPKVRIATTIADWLDELSKLRFDAVGSLYRNRELDPGSPGGFLVGPPVVQQFFGDWRLDYDFDHGPFWNLYSYTKAFVDCAREEAKDSRQLIRAKISALEDEIENTDGTEPPRWKTQMVKSKLSEETEEQRSSTLERLKERKKMLTQHVRSAELYKFIDWGCARYRIADIYGKPMDSASEAIRNCSKLDNITRRFCSNEDFSPNSTLMFHWDLSGNNVILDGSIKPIALLDWEQLYTLPIFIPNPYPDILSLNHLHSKSDSTLGVDDEISGDFMAKDLMCTAFLDRLQRLKSPWLELFGNRDELLRSLVETIEIGMYVGLSEKVDDIELALLNNEQKRFLDRLHELPGCMERQPGFLY